MFTRKLMLSALWALAVGAVPALATISPIVKPAIDRVPDGPLLPQPKQPFVTPNTPPPNVPSPIKGELRMVSTNKATADVASAKRYDDGRVYYGAQIGEQRAGPVVRYVRSGRWFPGRLIGRFFRRGGFFRRGC